MRRSTILDHRVRILEARIASLDPSVAQNFALVDARTEAELAFEDSQRLLKAIRWGSAIVAGSSLGFAVLSYLVT